MSYIDGEIALATARRRGTEAIAEREIKERPSQEERAFW